MNTTHTHKHTASDIHTRILETFTLLPSFPAMHVVFAICACKRNTESLYPESFYKQ